MKRPSGGPIRTLTQEAIALDVAERATLDFPLELPILSQSITVNSQPPLLNSSDPAFSPVVDQQFVQNMPLNGRSFQSLITLTPGTVLTAGSTKFNSPLCPIEWRPYKCFQQPF